MPKNYEGKASDNDDSLPYHNNITTKYLDPYYNSDIIKTDCDSNGGYFLNNSNNKGFGSFADRVRKFSPRTNELGEDIINRLKNIQRRKRSADKYFQPGMEPEPGTQPINNDDRGDWFHKEFDEMRNRNPRFRMPQWMSDEDDVSNLASRMSHSPRFSSFGRNSGPRRERINSAGSNRSGLSEEDHVDNTHHPHFQPFPNHANAIQIPIRLEAEAPPGWEPNPQTNKQSEVVQDQEKTANVVNQASSNSPRNNVSNIADAHYSPNGIPRNTRCVSAPPEMPEKNPCRAYGYSDSPYNPSSAFNNVPKPFVSSHKISSNDQPQYSESPNRHQYYQSPPNPNQWANSGQETSGAIRNIPIIFENQNESSSDAASNTNAPTPPSRSPKSQQSFFNKQPQGHSSNWDQRFHSPHFGFDHPFPYRHNDPFFDFPKENHPSMGNYYPNSSNQTHQSYQGPHSTDYHVPHSQTDSCPQRKFEKARSPPTQPSEPRDVKMDQISSVRNTVTELQGKVKNFEGKEKNKDYLYLDEMLTRALLQLDNIDPDGRDDLRQARKSLIVDINNTISALEKKIESQENSLANSSTGDNIPEESSKPKRSEEQNSKKDENISKTEITIDMNVPEPAKRKSKSPTPVREINSEQKQNIQTRHGEPLSTTKEESTFANVTTDSGMETEPIPLPPPPNHTTPETSVPQTDVISTSLAKDANSQNPPEENISSVDENKPETGDNKADCKT